MKATSGTARCVAVLALAVVAQGLGPCWSPASGEMGTKRLTDKIPRVIAGWKVTDEALGATEAAAAAAKSTLDCDEYVYRRYSRASLSFSVYTAHWSHGRVPVRLVASHTPDRCWTKNGMRCVDMQFRKPYSLAGKPLLLAEYRVFTAPSGERPTYVAYWHTVQGKLYDYGARFNAVPHPWLWWKDTVAQVMHGSREQLFVRISSETPFEELLGEPGFQAVMTKLGDLGLWAN